MTRLFPCLDYRVPCSAPGDPFAGELVSDPPPPPKKNLKENPVPSIRKNEGNALELFANI